MAINPESQYPGKIVPGNTNYPYGSARNVTVPGDGTGTPWEAALVNDLFGMMQALLAESQIVPTGSPDTAVSSQYVNAIRRVLGGSTNYMFSTVDDMKAGQLISGKTVGLKNGDSAFVQGRDLAGDGQRTEYLVKTAGGLIPDDEKIFLLDNGLVAVEQPPVQTQFQVMDFNFDPVFRREDDYSTAGSTIWGFAHTGQSLAEGGVGNDAVSGISPPLYPEQALTLIGGPVGRNTETLGAAVVGLEERSRVTIGSSYTRGMVEDNGVGSGFEAIFHGQAFGGKNYQDLKKGGSTGVYEKVIAQVADVKAARATVVYKAVSCIHGEQDGLENNTAYAANLAEWAADYDADIKSLTGQTENVQFLLCQTATAGGYNRNGGITETTFPTPLEQLEAHVNNPGVTMVCSKYHLDYFDHSHITNNAQRLLGEYYNKAFTKIEAGQGFEPLRPSSITGSGNTVVIDFVGNVGALAFDTTLVKLATNNGFDFVDDSGNTITDVSITGTAQVTITLSGTIGANPLVSYAYHNGDGGAANQVSGDGDRGNLRDSDTAVSLYNGARLYNWCVIFREPVA